MTKRVSRLRGEKRWKLKFALRQAQGHKCCWCGRHMRMRRRGDDRATIEHIVPLCCDGLDREPNIAASCGECNRGWSIRGIGPEDGLMSVLTYCWLRAGWAV